MTRREIAFFTTVLIIVGAGWGLTMPLTKIVVNAGFKHFGLIFWQAAIGVVAMTVVAVLRGKWLPMHSGALRIYATISAIGTVIPNTASYQAAVHLPAGVMSILMSSIPMLAFPIALAFGLDRFQMRRFGGLMAGLTGVLILVIPQANLPETASYIWVGVALVAALCYGFEGNVVAKWGTAGLDPIQVLFGASVLSALVTLPLALATGQFIDPIRSYGAPEYAHILSALIHVTVYTSYVWLVGRAGPVFAVQVSFLVTGFGVLWAKVLLDEQYSPYIWASLALMFVGLLLVQPKRNAPLAGDGAMGDT